MGRLRFHTDPKTPLPPGLYKKGRQFRARLSSSHPWVWFGSDYPAALAAFGAWKRASGKVRDVAWLLDQFTGVACQDRVRAGKLAERTARDYLRDSKVLKAGLGRIPFTSLTPAHIVKFRDVREVDAPTHVRNEMGCLSAALTWAVEAGMIATNPSREVRRPGKSIRERLITDDEYLAVYAKAGASVRLAMVLGVRTLGLPSDVLRMGPRNVMKYDDGRRTLRFRRGKTNVPVEVEIVGELAAALNPMLMPATLHPTFVRREDGKPYTVDGIGAMFRRDVVAAGILTTDDQGKQHVDFGLRDLRAKGATDMFRSGCADSADSIASRPQQRTHNRDLSQRSACGDRQAKRAAYHRVRDLADRIEFDLVPTLERRSTVIDQLVKRFRITNRVGRGSLERAKDLSVAGIDPEADPVFIVLQLRDTSERREGVPQCFDNRFVVQPLSHSENRPQTGYFNRPQKAGISNL